VKQSIWHLLDIRKSLGAQISLAFLVVALGPLAWFSMKSYGQIREATSRAVQDNLSALVSELGIEVESTVAASLRYVRVLAESPTLRSAQASLDEKLVEMHKTKGFYGVFEDITLVDPDGVVLASTTYHYQGEWKSKDWFKQARQGRPSVSPAHVIANPFKMVLVVTAPVLSENGTVSAVLCGQVNMHTIWEITERVRLGATGQVFIIDKAGNLLAYPDQRQLLEKLEPKSLLNSILGQNAGAVEFEQSLCQFVRLGGYEDYPGQDWRLGVIQAQAEVYNIMDSIRAQIITATVIGTLLIVLLSTLFSRTILRPIQELGSALERITQGDLAARVPMRSKDEIGMLAGTFNVMAEEIDRKTRELDTANRQMQALNEKLKESNTNLHEFAARRLEGAEDQLDVRRRNRVGLF
jgi:methyl-accepting chemotaxis protein